MRRILAAFVWLRWRMLINALEGSGARDTVERFSLAIEKLGPIMAAVLMIPSALGLAALGSAAGYALARGEQHSVLFEAVRFLLLAVPVLSIVGPLLLPAADRTNPVRMLLLPISRSTLYVAQSATTFGDPWMVLMLPLVLAIPVGLAAGGAAGAALFALVAAITLVLVIVGLSSLATSLLHLAVRDRRRGELLALLFILIIPTASMLPGLLLGDRRQRARTEGRPSVRERTAPEWLASTGERLFAMVPTELYVTGTRAASRREVAAAVPLAELAVTGVVLHALGLFAFGRVLDSPGSSGARRSVPTRAAWSRTLPGLSPGASAVALAQLRLGLRTPRGRSILLAPFIMLTIFGVLIWRNAGTMDFGTFHVNGGLGLATFASFVGLISILPIAMNQFAVDRAGLTLVLLSPLTDREYLTGKAVGNALIAGPPALFCTLASLAVFPGGAPALWLSIPIALFASYVIVAPVAAMLSAVFPRVVDMNSIGRGSNAHGLAGFLGLLAFVAAAAPCGLIVIAARLMHRPALTPVLMLAWCAVACVACWLLYIPARIVFGRRRENLALIRTTGSTQ